MAFTFSIEPSRLVRDVSSLSVNEVSVVSLLSSFALFLNDLNPGGNGGMCGGRYWYFWSSKEFLSWFVIGSFLYGDVASDFIFIFFLGMRFFGVALALVSPVNPELTDRSVQSLSTIINSGAGASYLVIKFVPLVTICVLIDSLGDMISPQIGSTTISFFLPITWWCSIFNWIVDII